MSTLLYLLGLLVGMNSPAVQPKIDILHAQCVQLCQTSREFRDTRRHPDRRAACVVRCDAAAGG